MNIKKYLILFISTLIFVSCTSLDKNSSSYWDNCNFERAYQRSKKIVKAINDQNPIIIYSMLSDNLRNQISEKNFVRNYNDELSYPYISPLYCYLQTIDLHYDIRGKISCKVASRLIGENYVFEIIYENSDYYFNVFEDIVNGTYKEKFSNKVIKWI